MYAIIETGGKQYRVEEGSKIVVEKLAGEAGSEIKLDKVLMLGGADVKVGAPYVENAAVTAEVVEQGRGALARTLQMIEADIPSGSGSPE